MNSASEGDWTLILPSALVWKDDRPLITLSDVPVNALDETFLHLALARGNVRGFVELDATPVPEGRLPIVGGIHHMTRCGSTLLCRQFSALERTMALSEPFAFQHLLEGPAASAAVTRRRIRQLANLWCTGLAPIAERVVIKWSNLVGQHATILAAALPEVPMIFLYRDPVEVLASIEARPLGGIRHVKPHHRQPEPVGSAASSDAKLETSARVIARTCRLAAGAPNLHTLDFAQLPAASWESVAPYFGFDPSPATIDAMRGAAAFHSKGPKGARPFIPDGQIKRDACSEPARMLATTLVAPAIAALTSRTPPLHAPVAQRQKVTV